MSEYWSTRTLTLYSLLHSLIISRCVTAVQFACSFSLLSVETSDSLITTLCRMETKVLLAFYHVPLAVHAISHSAQSYHASEWNYENGLYMTLAR